MAWCALTGVAHILAEEGGVNDFVVLAVRTCLK